MNKQILKAYDDYRGECENVSYFDFEAGYRAGQIITLTEFVAQYETDIQAAEALGYSPQQLCNMKSAVKPVYVDVAAGYVLALLREF